MRNAAALMFATLVAVGMGSTPVGAQSGPAEVEPVIASFLVPFSNRDVAGFIGFFADDATLFMPPTAKGASIGRVEGRPNIAREFEAMYARQAAPAPSSAALIKPQDLRVQLFGDTAVVTFHLGTDAARGRRTFVLRRTGAGWKIIHLHASTAPFP